MKSQPENVIKTQLRIHKGCGKLIHEDWEHAMIVPQGNPYGPLQPRRVPRLFCECGETITSDDQIVIKEI